MKALKTPRPGKAGNPITRIARTAVALVFAGAGVVLALAAAHQIVGHQNIGYAGLFGLLAAVCFAVASSQVARN